MEIFELISISPGVREHLGLFFTVGDAQWAARDFHAEYLKLYRELTLQQQAIMECPYENYGWETPISQAEHLEAVYSEQSRFVLIKREVAEPRPGPAGGRAYRILSKLCNPMGG